jgi:hypothetical protein
MKYAPRRVFAFLQMFPGYLSQKQVNMDTHHLISTPLEMVIMEMVQEMALETAFLGSEGMEKGMAIYETRAPGSFDHRNTGYSSKMYEVKCRTTSSVLSNKELNRDVDLYLDILKEDSTCFDEISDDLRRSGDGYYKYLSMRTDNHGDGYGYGTCYGSEFGSRAPQVQITWEGNGEGGGETHWYDGNGFGNGYTSTLGEEDGNSFW